MRSTRVVSRTAVALALVALPAGVRADDAAANEPLTEHDVLVSALGRAPLVDAVAGTVEAEQGRALSLRTAPNPVLAYSREQTFGAAGTAETYLSIAQVFDLGGRRRLRGEAGSARAQAAQRDGEAALLAVAADARLRFYEVLYRQRRVEALQRWATHVGAAVDIVTRREQHGDAATYDRRRLEREQMVATGRLATEQANLLRARTKLHVILSSPAAGADALRVAGSLAPESDPPELAVLQRAGATRADLASLELQVRAATVDREAAARWWQPDLRLELGWKGVAITAGGRTDGYLAGAALAFPLWDRGAGSQRLAAGEARAARGRRDLLATEVAAEVAGARDEAVQLRQVATDFETRSGTASRELVRMTSIGYEAGELGVLELLDAYRGAADDEALGLDMELAARRARIELDRLTGVKSP